MDPVLARPSAPVAVVLPVVLAAACRLVAGEPVSAPRQPEPREAVAVDLEGRARVEVRRRSHHIPAEPDAMLVVTHTGRLHREDLVPARAPSQGDWIQRQYSTHWAERRTVPFVPAGGAGEAWRVCARICTDLGDFEGRILPETSHVYVHEGRLAFNLDVEWIHPHDEDLPERWMGAIDV